MATPTPPEADGSSPQTRKFDEEPPMLIDTNKRYVATMVTSHGTMVIALDALAAPRAVNSFVFLARYHYYDGAVFHRIIPGFVLQGGDPTGPCSGGPDGVRLPPLYSHFGEVVTGLDVVEKINDVGSRSGTPTEQVVIESVTIEEKD